MCGTMIPTKPIRPLTETAAAVPAVAATTTSSRTRPTLMPRLAASSSPSAEHVEHAAVQHDHERADDDVRRREPDVAPACGGEAAEQPRVDVAQRVGVLLLHERLHRGHECGDRHAGEHERAGCARRPTERPSTYAQQTATMPPTNAAIGMSWPEPCSVAVGDRDRRAEPGAGRDAEQVRIGERVAEDALVRRAGEREHAADERAEHDPGRAELPEDRLLHRAERRVHVQERHVRQRRIGDRRRRAAPARRRARRRASRRGTPPRRAPRNARCPRAGSPAARRIESTAIRYDPAGGSRDGAREVDDPRPPREATLSSIAITR